MVIFYENRDRNLQINYGNCLNFAPHLHKHIELVYMLEGETVTYVNGNKAILNKGDIFISFPNQVHQYLSIGPEKYLLMIFSPDIIKEMSPIFNKYIPQNQIVKEASKHPQLFSLLSTIDDVYKSNYEYRSIQIKGYLLAFFAELLKIMKLKPIKTTNLNMLQNILIYCSENYTENLSLERISKALHISKYYVSHLLKEKINLGFSDYVNSLRISEACAHLMAREKTITEIAYLVGFNTIRTFNRTFIKHTGITPTAFRKEHY